MGRKKSQQREARDKSRPTRFIFFLFLAAFHSGRELLPVVSASTISAVNLPSTNALRGFLWARGRLRELGLERVASRWSLISRCATPNRRTRRKKGGILSSDTRLFLSPVAERFFLSLSPHALLSRVQSDSIARRRSRTNVGARTFRDGSAEEIEPTNCVRLNNRRVSLDLLLLPLLSA